VFAAVPPVAQWLTGCSGGALVVQRLCGGRPSADVKLKRWTDEDEDEDELPSGSNQIQMSSKNARRAGHFSQHRVTR